MSDLQVRKSGYQYRYLRMKSRIVAMAQIGYHRPDSFPPVVLLPFPVSPIRWTLLGPVDALSAWWGHVSLQLVCMLRHAHYLICEVHCLLWGLPIQILIREQNGLCDWALYEPPAFIVNHWSA